MFGKKPEPYELHEFVYGIVSAITRAKAKVDKIVVEQRKELEKEYGSLSELIPLTTFNMHEIEINLKYYVEPLNKNESRTNEDGTPKIMISPYSSNHHNKLDTSIQTINFKLTPKILKKYNIKNKEKIEHD